MKNIFGTDGIRGPVGSGIFVDDMLEQVGHMLAYWATMKYDMPRILLAYDTRESAPHIKKHLVKGALQKPVKIFDAGILPTPAVCGALQHATIFDCGIVISASHNPYYDNGIKVFDRTTVKLSTQEEEYISSHIGKLARQHEQGSYEPYTNAAAVYMHDVVTRFEPNFLQGLHIVLDTAHGATCSVAPRIFTTLGATITLIHNQPTGKNINDGCGAVHPESLQQAVLQHRADIGFAFDGDGDRVIAVNHRGEIKDGDDLLALLATSPSYSNEKIIVGTSMSNEGLVYFLKNHHKELIRAEVGDKKVYEKLVYYKGQLGGENSGHLVMRDYLPTGDGIFTALKIVQTTIETGNRSMETFVKFPQELINIPVQQKKDLRQEPLATYIKRAEEALTTGRLVVRYSGTQNMLRIMVEDQDAARTKKIAQDLAEHLKGTLNS